MLVCPFCRASNPEVNATCSTCGRELRQGVQPVTSIVRREPPEVPAEPPVKPGPRWGRISAVVTVVVLVAGFVVWTAVRPQACDHKFSSSQIPYCLTVPRGWNASIAHIGPTDVDQFVNLPATAVVMSLQLRTGVSLQAYANAARAIDQEKDLVAGPQTVTRLGGAPAYEWQLSVQGGRFQGVEVVTVHDDIGWTVQLDDDESTIGSHLDQFRSMLSSFHFR